MIAPEILAKKMSFPGAELEGLNVHAFDVLAFGIAYSAMLHAASNNPTRWSACAGQCKCVILDDHCAEWSGSCALHNGRLVRPSRA